MPFVKEQLTIVNNLLKAGPLQDSRFAAGQFTALAFDVVERLDSGVKIFPGTMSDNFTATPVTADDKYSIQVYNKLLGKQYLSDGRPGYGDAVQKAERLDVKMVVYARAAQVKLTAEQLEAQITTNFPETISKSLLTPFNLDSMTVTLVSCNMNALQVFSEEYRGYDLFIGPEDIYFSIRYSIETKYRKGCINFCAPNCN